MPPKPSKKEVEKKQKKVVEDKTFGLKNKNKSKKVQNFVQQVAQQAKFQGRSRKDVLDDQKKKEEREAKKIAEKMTEEVGQLFKAVVDTGKMKAAIESGVDPKSILCEFFKKGMCKRGAACKYSHDADAVRKTAKIDLYKDPRELEKERDSMDKWDQNKLESVIAEKNKKRGLPPTEIVCKFFIDAIEKRQYGWLWECPNGEVCHYRHALPPGFVLKSQAKSEEKDEEDETPIEEKIEEERRQLDLSKCTPLTQEVFYKWREDKKRREQEEKERQRLEEAKKEGSSSGKAGFRILSGKDLFRYDPTLFIDDDEADDEKYEIEQKTEEDWQKEQEEDDNNSKDEKNDEKQEDSADNDEKIEGAVTVFSEELFLDDDEQLPEDGNDDDEQGADADDNDNDGADDDGDETVDDDNDGEHTAASSSSSASS